MAGTGSASQSEVTLGCVVITPGMKMTNEIPRPARGIFLLAVLAVADLAPAPLPGHATDAGTGRWVLDGDQARALLAEGALLVDAWGADLKKAAPLEGAAAVIWQDFTNADLPVKGRLLQDDAALTQKLQGIGLSKNVPAVVVPDSVNGRGEDGRIVWTFRTLGHPQTFLVNGGIAALLEEGPLDLKPAKLSGDFTVVRTESYEIRKENPRRLIGKDGVTVRDVREPREFAGKTPLWRKPRQPRAGCKAHLLPRPCGRKRSHPHARGAEGQARGSGGGCRDADRLVLHRRYPFRLRDGGAE